jgi:hypothetical protein
MGKITKVGKKCGFEGIRTAGNNVGGTEFWDE